MPLVILAARWRNPLWRCDRHGHELAGESPAITLERREYVGEGKGARRNSFDLPEEG